MEETLPDVQTAEKVGLLASEYERIVEILGRKPNFTELSVYAVMWSEHCSYKNSILWLKKLPKDGPQILTKAGEENAGVVDIGDGLACSFKIESHNHPSAIEPYQGAATGVGGINRDIFSMGARPIAQLNSLRFGDPSLPKTKRLLKGVVKGIGDYGNSFGVPTVGGEVYFDPCYNTNPLVNAFSAGIVEHGKTAVAKAEGAGNPVFIVGSATGKDGIHGATFASEDITEASEGKLPAVQVGDPFQEKLLLESTLESLQTGKVIGVQDMGAAGITCSTSEMSESGGVGMDIWLEKVPLRQPDMKPFEILLSESQERMLLVVEKGGEEAIQAVFEKWDLPCEQIGEVNDTGMLRYYMKGELTAEVPAESLVLGGGAPQYERDVEEPPYFKETQEFDPDAIQEPNDLYDVAEYLLKHPNICSRHFITEQYDSMVGTATLTTNKPSDAGVVQIKGQEKAIVIAADCNSRYVHANPEVGAAIAVAESARNIVCSGGEPLAITNCLNFGNPYDKYVYWQFTHAIKGITQACNRLNTPVTGGNVSFYNQNPDGGPVFPTPVIGMLGLMNDLSWHTSMAFQQAGDHLYLLGPVSDDMACSEYLYSYHQVKRSPAPFFDLEKEHRIQQLLMQLIQKGLVQSAHDVSDGGLFIALAESAMAGDLGFELSYEPGFRMDAFLFGEGQSRMVVSVSHEHQGEFEKAAGKDARLIGKVTGGGFNLFGENFITTSEAQSLYGSALEKHIS